VTLAIRLCRGNPDVRRLGRSWSIVGVGIAAPITDASGESTNLLAHLVTTELRYVAHSRATDPVLPRPRESAMESARGYRVRSGPSLTRHLLGPEVVAPAARNWYG